jgi:hypothetical protein
MTSPKALPSRRTFRFSVEVSGTASVLVLEVEEAFMI